MAVGVLLVGSLSASHPRDVRAGVGPRPANGSTTQPAGVGPPGGAAPVAPTQAPARPPVAVCDSVLLRGPAAAPQGAVVVGLSDDLESVTDSNDPGTTFWLAAGTHHLGDGQYNQVHPKAGNRYVGAPGAIIDGRHLNQYAFGGQEAGVHISYLTIQGFGSAGENFNEGVVNHDFATGWVFSHVTVQGNAGAGLLLGTDNVLELSCIRGNGQSGFNAYRPDGGRNLVVDRNEITDNNTDDWEESQPGCGCTAGGKFWDTRGAVVTNNYVHDNRGVGLWADTDNVGFRFQGNYFSENDGEALWYEISYNAEIIANTFIRNALVKGPANPGFPAGAVYLSEAGQDSRVEPTVGASFVIARNTFIDNWGGVVLWENADRFAGSPSNTSSDYGTLVNPEATVGQCAKKDVVSRPPYRSDCRWKTQNVQVHDNSFSFDPGRLGAACTVENTCGYQGLFSNSGSSPDWSPYLGDVVQRAITFSQNNKWFDNTYVGPWSFMVLAQGNTATWDVWRAQPYGQDVGSSMR